MVDVRFIKSLDITSLDGCVSRALRDNTSIFFGGFNMLNQLLGVADAFVSIFFPCWVAILGDSMDGSCRWWVYSANYCVVH